MQKLEVIFYGGTGSVTGANFLVQYGTNKFLVDCGLIQGNRQTERRNAEPFPYDPKEISHLFITHAHMDHIGRVPKLVHDGFEGKIISTEETREIATLALEDAYRVMLSKQKSGFSELLYEEKDVKKALSLWQGRSYEEGYEFEGIKVHFRDAGHILGSAMMEFEIGAQKIVFTGDLGNSPSPLLRDTEEVVDADYIIMESVYGDRNHESHEERRSKLKQAIAEGIKRGGEIIIPAFSIERTQVLLSELDNMIEASELPSIPVFLDSPLAAGITEIYKKFSKRFNKKVQEEISKGDEIFNFPKLQITRSMQDSAQIQRVKGSKIVIAGSGMSEGGRVRGHEKEILPDPKSTLILVGYQPAGTLGRHLEEGLKRVNIDQEWFPVRAKIVKIDGYSAHKDSDHLLQFVAKASESNRLKKVFVVMGEPKTSLFFVQRIREYVGTDAIYPEVGKPYEL